LLRASRKRESKNANGQRDDKFHAARIGN
jgi:hypothetical protein